MVHDEHAALFVHLDDPDAEVIASNRERWAWYERAKSCTSPGFRFFLSIKEEGSAAKWFAP